MRKTVSVVAAVIESEGRFFATQRGYGPWKDGWEFPGGKIEPGETPEAALAREIREELDADVAVGEKLTQVEYDYPEFHLSMGCYRCSLISGRLTLKEHEAARWLAPSELGAVAWLPADALVAEALLKAI
ncbi:MAG: (deoxy)nucleoside triphosphate pyrophosphohydrolase [Clostridia bacterium]|nr:(deoxy)nucleoside triphosphate pyrophosphohydrolase [Clostridia bacterium]